MQELLLWVKVPRQCFYFVEFHRDQSWEEHPATYVVVSHVQESGSMQSPGKFRCSEVTFGDFYDQIQLHTLSQATLWVRKLWGEEFPPKKKALEETLSSCALNNKISYRISSVRCHGYYFFCCSLLCSYYSSAATIRGQRLFLQKTHRHQRRLDKVHTSDTVMTFNHCQ